MQEMYGDEKNSDDEEEGHPVQVSLPHLDFMHD